MKAIRWLALLAVAGGMFAVVSQAQARTWFFYRSPGYPYGGGYYGNYYPTYNWPYYYQPYSYYPYGTVSYPNYSGGMMYGYWPGYSYGTPAHFAAGVDVRSFYGAGDILEGVRHIRRRATVYPAVLVGRDFDLRDFEPDDKLKKPAKH